jgi:hypothetical protein
LDLIIDNSEIEKSNYGVYLRYSDNCTLHSLVISECGIGLNIAASYDGVIKDSIIRRCSTGLYFSQSEQYNVTNSIFGGNEYLGVRLVDCIGFFIYSNRFVGEDLAVDNHYDPDSQAENHFDDGVGTGNAWSDYTGSGQYIVSGSKGSIDRWPSLAEVSEPTLEHLDDMTFTSTEKIIIWDASDDNPYSYRVLLDGHVIDSGSWDGTSITIDLSFLEVGEYILKIEVDDYDGHVESWGIIVTVEQSILDLTGFLILGISGVLFAVVVIAFMKFRNRTAQVG